MRRTDPNDVNSLDAIIRALYETISGKAGAPRDWDRLRSLFYPSARLLRSIIDGEGPISMSAMSVDEFIAVATAYARAKDFHEREIARQVQHFGQIAHVFSTFEASTSAAGSGSLGRGINSIQLWNDGRRWWVMSMLWDNERPDCPISAEFLPQREEGIHG